jgi:hypothetical protein
MPVEFACPQCRKTVCLSDAVVGGMLRCPDCQESVPVPARASKPAPADSLAMDDLEEALPGDPTVLSKQTAPVNHDPVPRRDYDRDERREPQRSRRESDADWDDRPLRRSRADDRDWDRDRPRERDRDCPRPAPSGRRRWRIGLILGIVAVVLLLCGGFGTLCYFGIKAIIDQTSDPAIPPANWATFRPSGGRCTISMPGKPILVTVRGMPADAVVCQEYDLALPEHKRTFTIATMDFSADVMAAAVEDKLFEVALARGNQLAFETGESPESVFHQDIMYKGLPGGEMQHYFGFNSLIERSVLVRHRDGSATAYFVRVSGIGVRPDSPEMVQFFESLQFDPEGINPDPAIKGKAPKPPANPNPKPGLAPPMDQVNR